MTDLTPGNFTIYDERERQTVSHFTTQAFSSLAPDDSTPRLRSASGLEAAPVTHRTFLILLGRGRLDEPSEGMAAMIDFVRSRLLPQDQVGVIAYNRAFGLTSEREPVIRLLESYRERHTRIEARMRFWFRGLQATYGSREIPPGIQSLMDDVFEAAGVPAARSLALGNFGDDAYDETRRAIAGLDDDDDGGREGYDDLRSLFAAIEFLRYLEGEKHVLYVGERPLSLPGRRGVPLSDRHPETRVLVGVEAGKQVDGLAELAADARVSISVIQTGGLGGAGLVQDGRYLAEHTGGIASYFRYAREAVDRLDRATTFQYLLGYYPASAQWNGEYRRIRVEVDRPGVTVHYRHGYRATAELVPYDRRAFMAHHRVLAAASDARRIEDIRVLLSEPVVTTLADGEEIAVDVRIDVSQIAFRREGDFQIASLNVAVFAGDSEQELAGEAWEQVDLRLESATYERLRREGFVCTLKVSADKAVRHLKAVAYDYFADRLGVAEKRVRSPYD